MVQFDTQLPPDEFYSTLGLGLYDEDVLKSRRRVFGSCSIPVPRTPLLLMWVDELTAPLYVFQLAAIVLWVWDNYTNYACLVLAMSLLSTFYDLNNSKYVLAMCYG